MIIMCHRYVFFLYQCCIFHVNQVYCRKLSGQSYSFLNWKHQGHLFGTINVQVFEYRPFPPLCSTRSARGPGTIYRPGTPHEHQCFIDTPWQTSFTAGHAREEREASATLTTCYLCSTVLYSTRPFSPPIIIKQVFLLLCLHLGNSTTVHRSFPTCRDP